MAVEALLDKKGGSGYGGCADSSDSTSSREEGALEHLWHQLTHYESAPFYCQDNEYITTGYRKQTASWSKCLQTVLHWHNETINVCPTPQPPSQRRALTRRPSQIHSHLWPSVFAAAALIAGSLTVAGYFNLLPPPSSELTRQGWRAIITPVYPFHTKALPSVGPGDTIVWAVFFAGATVCFGASAFFHTSLCHSHPVVERTRRLDFLGIFLMGNAAFIPSFYYSFGFCDPHLFTVYVAMMTVSCFSEWHTSIRKP